MKKPLVELVDPDPAKAIFGCTFMAIILLCMALIHFVIRDWSRWDFYIIPAFLLLPMIVQYLVWQRKGVKKPKITLGPEGFCIGNRASPFSLNAKGKLKWGKPHLFLWEDIKKITLDDRDPDANVFKRRGQKKIGRCRRCLRCKSGLRRCSRRRRARDPPSPEPRFP